MFSDWRFYVVLAGLSWGTYVPIIFYGGSELGGKPNARIMAVLCVGLAYFVIAVVLPLVLFLTGVEPWPEMKANGLIFSSLAGVAGAIGALCVIFATKSAVAEAQGKGVDLATFRVFIAPLIFSLAPVINVLLSMVWHPKPGDPFNFGFEPPGWKLWVGILLISCGAALVLYSKEEAEEAKKKAIAAAKKAAPAPQVASNTEPPNPALHVPPAGGGV